MKTLKLAILPVALLATSAFAHNHEVVEPVAYNAENGIIKNTTTQVTDGVKTLFNKATHPGAISAEVGTLGYGGHITWGVNPKTDLVAGWNGGELDFDADIGGDDSIINWKKVFNENMATYEGNLAFKADMNNPYLGVRLRPWANNFNVSTGVIFNDNKYELSLENNTPATYTIDGAPKNLDAGTKITVDAEYRNTVAPYLTIGFAPSSNKRWGFFGEVGAAYVGDLKTNVSTNVDLATAPQDLKDVVEDVEKEVQDANLKIHPIVKAGVTVRF